MSFSLVDCISIGVYRMLRSFVPTRRLSMVRPHGNLAWASETGPGIVESCLLSGWLVAMEADAFQIGRSLMHNARTLSEVLSYPNSISNDLALRPAPSKML